MITFSPPKLQHNNYFYIPLTYDFKREFRASPQMGDAIMFNSNEMHGEKTVTTQY